MAEYKNGDTASWDSQEVRRAQGEQPQRKKTRRRRRRRSENHEPKIVQE